MSTAEQRAYWRRAGAKKRARARGDIYVPTCPDCGAPRATEETLRAHRAIAHGTAV